MITALTNDRCFALCGKSTDSEKPLEWNGIKLGNGSTFLEIDTGKRYIFDEEGQEWLEFTAQ